MFRIKLSNQIEREGEIERGSTRDVRRVFEFLCNATTRGRRSVGDDLLNEIDIGEPTFTQLPNDPESILIDPNISSSINRVVHRVQSRKRAPHFSIW